MRGAPNGTPENGRPPLPSLRGPIPGAIVQQPHLVKQGGGKPPHLERRRLAVTGTRGASDGQQAFGGGTAGRPPPFGLIQVRD